MLLDIALGAFVVHVFRAIVEITTTPFHYFIGVMFMLLPDIDAIWHYIRTHEIAAHAGSVQDHRDGLHYPLVYIPVGTVIIGVLFGGLWLAIFFFCSLLHFLHDSMGTGWGIKLLWPFSRKNYKMFCKKDGTLSRRLIMTWTPEELRNVIIAHGDPEWIQNIFIRPLLRGGITLPIAALLFGEILLPLILSGYIIYNHLK